MLTEHLSPANRQDVPFNAPMHEFLGATARLQEEKAEMRYQKKMNQMVDPVHDEQLWQRKMRDHEIIHNYRRTVTDMRGTQTKTREGMTIPKP
jgi:hypothetical protein